ncbi:hypothetical protein [Salinicoccus roseus]|uniref:hypothetical protein n=1 Tax=Salinicoccus roseus TaxID=45670 RepID=UPI0023013D24|nr:hypothetical protein [Salinicoccus roseus]
MKKILFYLAIFTVVFGVFSQETFAQEESKDQLSPEEEKEIRENFTELGISDEDQKHLIEKLNNGQAIDSMKEKNMQKAMAASQRMLETKQFGEDQTMTFADGSKIEYGHELVNSADDENVYRASSSLNTARSYWNVGVLNYQFYTDFSLASGNNYIDRSYDYTINVIGGSYSNVSLTVERKYETTTHKAYSRLGFSYSIATGTGSPRLYFNVGDNSYDTTLSLSDRK